MMAAGPPEASKPGDGEASAGVGRPPDGPGTELDARDAAGDCAVVVQPQGRDGGPDDPLHRLVTGRSPVSTVAVALVVALLGLLVLISLLQAAGLVPGPVTF